MSGYSDKYIQDLYINTLYFVARFYTRTYFYSFITGFSSTFVEKAANIMILIDKKVFRRKGNNWILCEFCSKYSVYPLILLFSPLLKGSI